MNISNMSKPKIALMIAGMLALNTTLLLIIMAIWRMCP
jgi:hypothetical protein